MLSLFTKRTSRAVCQGAQLKKRSMSSMSATAERFRKWTTQARPDWKTDKTEAFVLFVVFGITGSSSVALVRPLLKNFLGIEGSLWEGPNSYRAMSLILISPVYALILLTVVMNVSIFVQHNFFCQYCFTFAFPFIP